MYFDSLTHPTLDGLWINGKRGETFADVARNVAQSGCIGACAVALPGVGSYRHDAYFAAATSYPVLFPVAALTDTESCEAEIEHVAKIGFRAIKVHPRLLHVHPTDTLLARIFKSATQAGVVVMLCTYYHSKPTTMIPEDPYWHLVRALAAAPDVRVVLLHGGGVRVLEYAELCRFSDNLLLDLSFTAQKYSKSSLAQDITYLVESFDRKICFGSDSPEFSIASTLSFLKTASSGLDATKIENFSYRNLMKLLGLQLPAPQVA